MGLGNVFFIFVEIDKKIAYKRKYISKNFNLVATSSIFFERASSYITLCSCLEQNQTEILFRRQRTKKRLRMNFIMMGDEKNWVIFDFNFFRFHGSAKNMLSPIFLKIDEFSKAIQLVRYLTIRQVLINSVSVFVNWTGTHCWRKYENNGLIYMG